MLATPTQPANSDQFFTQAPGQHSLWPELKMLMSHEGRGREHLDSTDACCQLNMLGLGYRTGSKAKSNSAPPEHLQLEGIKECKDIHYQAQLLCRPFRAIR